MQVASVQVVKNQFSTVRIMSDIFAMANAIYLRYDIHFTLFVCDMPSAFYSVIADLKSIFHRRRSPFFSKKVKSTLYLYMSKNGEGFIFFSMAGVASMAGWLVGWLVSNQRNFKHSRSKTGVLFWCYLLNISKYSSNLASTYSAINSVIGVGLLSR